MKMNIIYIMNMKLREHYLKQQLEFIVEIKYIYLYFTFNNLIPSIIVDF